MPIKPISCKLSTQAHIWTLDMEADSCGHQKIEIVVLICNLPEITSSRNIRAFRFLFIFLVCLQSHIEI